MKLQEALKTPGLYRIIPRHSFDSSGTYVWILPTGPTGGKDAAVGVYVGTLDDGSYYATGWTSNSRIQKDITDLELEETLHLEVTITLK